MSATETTHKPGDLARLAAAREAVENKPASLDDMLGRGPTVVLADGQPYRVFHVRIGHLGHVNELISRLGDYGLVALSGGNPQVLQKALQMKASEDADEEADAAAMEIGLLASVYALDADACIALVELSTILLNGPGQEVTPEQAGELVDTETFPLLMRASGLPNPRTPRPAAG